MPPPAPPAPAAPPVGLDRVLRTVDRMSDVFAFGAAAALVLLAVNVLADVIGRAVFKAPVHGTLEYTENWWMPALTLMAFAYIEKHCEHIKVTILLDALPTRMRQLVEGGFGLIAVALLIGLTWSSAVSGIESAGYGQTTAGRPAVPIWPFKLLAPVAIAMLKAGYKPQLAVGSVAAAGTLGQIIPPSLLLVVYAGAASVPVGQQLLAGIVPGLLLALAFALVIVGQAILRPSLALRVDMSQVSWPMRFAALVETLPIMIVVTVVIGGLFAGIFTATEAGVVGMFAALGFGILQMRRAGDGWGAVWRMVRESVTGTLHGTASVFLLIVGVEVLTRAMALSQVPNAQAGGIVDLGFGRVELLLLLILVYLVLGMFMDTLAMMVLTIPVLLAPLQALGVDPLWYGVFVVVMAEVGLLTPPLGILTFIVHRIALDPEANLGRPISFGTVFRGVAPFALTAMAVLLLLILFPGVVTWLPELSAGS